VTAQSTPPEAHTAVKAARLLGLSCAVSHEVGSTESTSGLSVAAVKRQRIMRRRAATASCTSAAEV
jgi:hypothetical protein